MAVYCGIDWAEGHHDIALVNDDGKLIAKRRIDETPDGIAELTAMLAAAGDSEAEPIPVAIETPRGLLIAVLRATGRPIYPINPLAVARYRERTSISGKKSDHVDAMALANILRTDAHLHRMLPDDSGLARSITVLARAYQDAVWRRTKLVQELRARLREYYPGFLAAFAAGSGSGRGLSTTQLASSDARAVLAVAPSPAEGLRVSQAKVETALRCGGRQRRITSLAAGILTALRVPQLRQDSVVEQAMRTETLALLGVLNAVCDSVDQLAAALIEAFTQHPDYEIITSFPGLADISGAIVLAEISDDRNRFADDRALQAFAGSAPLTRASGKSRTVTRRRTKNNRLAAIGYSWAFTAAARPSPTREHYLYRRDRGDGHPAALRHLFNRMLGQLHHCLRTRQPTTPSRHSPTTPHTGSNPPDRLLLDIWRHRRSQALGGPLGQRRDGSAVAVAEFIAVQRAEFGVPHAAACRALGVSQAWFYQWRHGNGSPRRARRRALAALVAALFARHRGTYGAPRITADLQEMGWRVSHNTVAAVMAEQGLRARGKRRRRGTTRPGQGRWRAPDLVSRDFSVRRVNQRWFGDGTEIDTAEGKLQLASVLDVCSRRIVGFALSEHHDAALAYGSLAMAVAVRGGR